jgi:hypothetical protein
MKTFQSASIEAIPRQDSQSLPFDQRVATAAYFRAQERGFSPGGELEDWLEAEREISAAKDEGTSSI